MGNVTQFLGGLALGARRRPGLAAAVLMHRLIQDPARVPGVRRGGSRARARARQLWRAGNLSAAAQALPPGDRLRRLYDGERAALTRIPGRPARVEPVHGVPHRVLHFVGSSLPETRAGHTLRTHSIVRAQRAIGMDPHVVTQWGWPAGHGRVHGRNRVLLDGVPYHRLGAATAPEPLDVMLRRGIAAATDLTRLLRPCLLHATTDYRNGTVALGVREATGLPLVYELRGFVELSWLAHAPAGACESTERVVLQRRRDLDLMAAADLVTTLSETMRAEIVRRGIPADKVVVIPNAVDAGALRRTGPHADLRRDLGIAPEEFVVGALSKLAAYEGFEVLLAAAALLRERGTPIRVVLFGAGPRHDALARLARDLTLPPGAVLLPGPVSGTRVARAYATLDVFAVPRPDLPVTRLVTPLKPVEAMAAGCPLVLSDLPPLREVATRGGTHSSAAELVPPGDAGALADTLESLRFDVPRRNALIAAGSNLVAAHWTWEAVAHAQREMYLRLAASPAPAAA
ncbi:MAG: glycosyltransferase [Sporichthyaceae bacterium]